MNFHFHNDSKKFSRYELQFGNFIFTGWLDKERQPKTDYEKAILILEQNDADYLIGYIRESWQFTLTEEYSTP